MTVHLATFSDESMSRAAQACLKSAKEHGAEVGRVFTDDDICAWFPARDVVAQNRTLFDSPRGCGYWAWKPLIIDALLRLGTKDGDILIYSDAGVEFINNVSYIIDRMDQDIFLFGNNWEHAHWCKRDVVHEIWHGDIDVPETYERWIVQSLLQPWAAFGKQVQASVIFFRVSDYTRSFVAEWLKWCLFEGGRLINDSPSRLPNHPEFREHRHDQAILTTMAYREGLRLHYWPAMYNDGAFSYEKLPEYASDDYPILFHHHRRRNIDWEQGRIRFSALARQQTGCA